MYSYLKYKSYFEIAIITKFSDAFKYKKMLRKIVKFSKSAYIKSNLSTV